MPAAAIIISIMTTEVLRRLLIWLSPAFPTGGFAYSHGLEWAVEDGAVRDEATLTVWVEDLLTHGAGRCDAILLYQAHAAAEDALPGLCALGVATGFGRERRLETVAQGNAFVRAAGVWGGTRIARLTGLDVPYPVAVGAACADHHIAADAAAPAYLQAFAASLISAAVRLVPLGQTAGLRVLVALEPIVAAVAEEAAKAGLDDLGGACLRSDIAALRHETQETRLFRT